MADLRLPLLDHDGWKWGRLNLFGNSDKQVICAESFSTIKEKYTFKGGHRVRLYALKGNIHWRIPADTKIDIVDVPTATVPTRRQGGKKD